MQIRINRRCVNGLALSRKLAKNIFLERIRDQNITLEALNNTYTSLNSVRPRVVTDELTVGDVYAQRASLAIAIDEAIGNLSTQAFKNPDRAQVTKKALSQEIRLSNNSIVALLQTDKFNEAIDKLSSLRAKMDGSIGGSASDDVIIGRGNQAKIVPMIDNFILALQKR